MSFPIETVPIPEGSGRITASTPVWEALVSATIHGVAVKTTPPSKDAAKRLVNTLARRAKKAFPAKRLRSMWNAEEKSLTLWISD